MSAKEYFITRLSFREDEKMIQDVFAYEYNGNSLSDGETRQRLWMVARTTEGSQISIMTPDPNKENSWQREKPFAYENGLYSWSYTLPRNITKRKTFVSYYHRDDQDYHVRFQNLFGDLIVSKSVQAGDIDSENSTDYVKQLIQKDFLSDVTILVVLVGPKTLCRKHVDWEISGALNLKVGNSYAGLIGLLLPTHPEYGKTNYKKENLPMRLAANLDSGFATLYDWSDDRVVMQKRIESAYLKRDESEKIINQSIPQMQNNLCD